MSNDSRAFRDALGTFATGVTLISTLSPDGEPIAITVNSFSSVSLDPPLVLFSLARTAGRFDDFVAAGKFAVNILATDHQALSDRYARHGEDSLAEVPHERGETGCALLTGTLATFDCRTEAIHDGGDHVILVGRVVGISTRDCDDAPLLYYRGRYADIAKR